MQNPFDEVIQAPDDAQSSNSKQDTIWVDAKDIEQNDDIPSANARGQDGTSHKKLKTLGVAITCLLIMVAGIAIAAGRISEGKARDAQAAAQAAADEAKTITTRTSSIADKQAALEQDDLPAPLDFGNEEMDAPFDTAPYEDAPYQLEPMQVVPAPNPYDDTQAGRDYVYSSPSANALHESPEPAPAITSEPAPIAGVLVDIHRGGGSAFGADNADDALSERMHEPAYSKASHSAPDAYLTQSALVLKKGAVIPCTLKTKIDSTYAGFVICQTTKDVYSSDGKALLVARGSQVFGIQNIEVTHGKARVGVIWNRLDTPDGASFDLSSPAVGPLGQAGVKAHMNNQYGKRFGGALLLSVIQDAIAAGTTHLKKEMPNSGTTIQNTTNQTQEMATKALEGTINIPPIATVNQGTRLHILVADDLDFSTVYALKGRP